MTEDHAFLFGEEHFEGGELLPIPVIAEHFMLPYNDAVPRELSWTQEALNDVEIALLPFVLAWQHDNELNQQNVNERVVAICQGLRTIERALNALGENEIERQEFTNLVQASTQARAFVIHALLLRKYAEI